MKKKNAKIRRMLRWLIPMLVIALTFTGHTFGMQSGGEVWNEFYGRSSAPPPTPPVTPPPTTPPPTTPPPTSTPTPPGTIDVTDPPIPTGTPETPGTPGPTDPTVTPNPSGPPSPGKPPQTSDNSDPGIWLISLATGTFILRRVLFFKKIRKKEKLSS